MPPYVWCGVKYTDLVSLAPVSGKKIHLDFDGVYVYEMGLKMAIKPNHT